MIRALCSLLVLVTVSRAALARVVPPDPEAAGEWLAFCTIELPKDLAPEAKGAWKVALEAVLIALARDGLAVEAAGLRAIAGAVDEAVAGRSVAFSCVPSAVGHPTVKIVKSADTKPELSSASSEWPAHRAKVDAAHPGLTPGIEVAINLNALRREFEASFDVLPESRARSDGSRDYGRGARLLEAMQLSNARMIGLHMRLIKPEGVMTRDPSLPRGDPATVVAYLGPALLVLDITWSARSRPPGTISLFTLTTNYWPASQLGTSAPAECIVAAAMRVAWKKELERALGVYAAVLPPKSSVEFLKQRDSWFAQGQTSINRLTSSLDPWVGFGLSTRSPGEVMIVSHLRPGTSASATAASVGSVLGAFVEPGSGASADGLWNWKITPIEGCWARAIRWSLHERKPPDRSALNGSIQLMGLPAK